MDNERHSEYRSWRHRLEEPGALPGAGLTDKEAAWDKLYERLGETPRRQTLPWLWAAAACLVLALVPAAFFLRERKVVPRPNTPEMTITQSSSQDHSSRPVIPLHPARRERPAGVKRPGLTPVVPHPPILAPIAIQSPIPGAMEHPSLPDRLPETRPVLPKPLIVAQAPPKKELRVVHINELEPPQPAPSTAGLRLKPGRLHIGLIPAQDVLRPATTYETYQTDHPIIFRTFKHTTPNP